MPIRIIASTNVQDYVFEPCMEDTPVPMTMTAVEIKEIHSKSRLFTDGWLVFEDDVKESVYNFLKIRDWENILSQVELMNCIISGSKEDVERLINIKSKGYFERVYGIYVALKQSNMYDISMRVAKAIDYRYKELQRGIINTQIKLSDTFKTDERDKIIAEQKALLEEKEQQANAMSKVVGNFEKQIAELTKQIEMLTAQTKTDENEEKEETPTQPKRGRPKKVDSK
jgi:hypothetical protein